MTETQADAVTTCVVVSLIVLGFWAYSTEWGQRLLFLWDCGFTDTCRDIWELGNG